MTGEPRSRTTADDEVRPFRASDLFWFVTLAWAALMCAVLVLVNSPGTYIAAGLEGFLVTAIAVVSLLITWAASPLAWLLGRGMRRVRSVVAHLVVFGVVGFLAGGVLGAVGSSFARAAGDEVAVAAGAVCAVCAVLGRAGAFTARWVAGRRTRRTARSAAQR